MRFIQLVGGPYYGAIFEHETYVPDLAFPERNLLGRIILDYGEVLFYVRPVSPSLTYCVYRIDAATGKFIFESEQPTK